MKRRLAVALITAGILSASGCHDDYYARQIVQPNTNPGRILQLVGGTGQQMLAQGRIDLHRRIAGPDGTISDIWVLSAKPKSDTRPLGTVVLLHGLGESKAEFPYFGLGRRLANAGFDVVLPDLRAHGRSEGEYITYGAKEKHDIKAVMDALIGAGQVSEPVYAFGTDLGGTVAIQYAAIDPRCRAVMAVSPYQDVTSVGWRICKFHAPAMSVEHFQRVMERAGKIADFDPPNASAVDAAAKLRIPLLLVHGVLYQTVPLEHTQAVYDAAAGPKKLETPALKQILLPAILEDWLAKRIVSLARQGLPDGRS